MNLTPPELRSWRECKHLDPKLFDFMDLIADAQLIPIQEYYIDHGRLNQWIHGQYPNRQELAQEISSYIRRIGFNEFLIRLQESVYAFITQLQPDDEYALIVPIKVSDATNVQMKSNWWVSQLVLRILCYHNWKLPIGIYDSIRHAFSYANVFMTCDDAIYSGQQLKRLISKEDMELSQLLQDTLSQLPISIIVAYGTNYGIDNIMSVATNHVQPRVISAERLIGLSELMPGVDLVNSHQPLVYFQHKMPDQVSVNHTILSGQIIDHPRSPRIPFISGCENAGRNCPEPWYRSPEYISLSEFPELFY